MSIKYRVLMFALMAGIFTACTMPACAYDYRREQFKTGVGDYPYAWGDADALIDAFQKASIAGNVIMHHVPFKWGALNGRPFDELFPECSYVPYLVSKYDLELLLIAEPTSGCDRREIAGLPEGYEKRNFGDPAIRLAYKKEALWLAEHFKPKYMALAAEIDGYYIGHPEDFNNFVSLYKETYKEIKRMHPEITLFVYFQYEGLQGGWRPSAPYSELPLENLWFLMYKFLPCLDAAGFSSYPELLYDAPKDVPADYYAKIAAKTKLPVIFAELGWSSCFDPEGFHANTEWNQAFFIIRFFYITRNLNKELAVWYFLHDMEGEPFFDGQPDWLKTMGLRDTDGEAKPAWKAWRYFGRCSRKPELNK